MVSRVQERVIQQGLRDPRAIAEGAGPSTSTLLGGACSPPTAHWFLSVGSGRQCVVTSILRIGISFYLELADFLCSGAMRPKGLKNARRGVRPNKSPER